MRRLIAVVLLVGMSWAGIVSAQDAAQDTPLGRAIGKNPDQFMTQVTDLIAGYGGPQGLTPDGIDDYVALERAGARASAMRRMMAMDLDVDGVLVRAELAVSQRAASAYARGRMERQFLAADTDGDGRVDATEMAAEGLAAGLRSLTEDEAEALRALMTLDRDGNGALTSAEVAAALVLLDKAT